MFPNQSIAFNGSLRNTSYMSLILWRLADPEDVTHAASFSADWILFGCSQIRWLQPCSEYFCNFVTPFVAFFPSLNDLWEWLDISQTDQSELGKKSSHLSNTRRRHFLFFYLPPPFTFTLFIFDSFSFSGYSVYDVVPFSYNSFNKQRPWNWNKWTRIGEFLPLFLT